MIGLDLKLDGVIKMKLYLKKIEKLIDTRLKSTRKRIGKYILVKDARRYAPVDTGLLRKAITSKVNGDDIIVYVPSSSKASDYARYMHDGNYNLGRKSRSGGSKVGRKYIKRSIDDNESKMAKALKRVFRGIK